VFTLLIWFMMLSPNQNVTDILPFIWYNLGFCNTSEMLYFGLAFVETKFRKYQPDSVQNCFVFRQCMTYYRK
jgi:hypothetical protein